LKGLALQVLKELQQENKTTAVVIKAYLDEFRSAQCKLPNSQGTCYSPRPVTSAA